MLGVDVVDIQFTASNFNRKSMIGSFEDLADFRVIDTLMV